MARCYSYSLDDWVGDEHLVDVHIAHLRRKLGDDPDTARYISTVRGIGYGIDRPEGIALSFQVSLYKVEPSEAVFACNLFAKDMLRSALADEVEECWP